MKTPKRKTLRRLGLAGLAAMAAAGPASAYTLSPLDITAHLKGSLLFTPQGSAPFTCKVDLVLKTKDPNEGYKHNSEIVSEDKTPSGKNCLPDVVFYGLPWIVGVGGPTSGIISGVSWVGGASDSCIDPKTPFTVNSSGVWTIPSGQCFTGTLTSNPPVTIAP